MSHANRSALFAGIIGAMFFTGSASTASAQVSAGASPASEFQAKQTTRAPAPRRVKVSRVQAVPTTRVERCDNLLCKFFVILGIGY